MRSGTSTIARALRDIGREFHARGWVLGTSGNFSAVLSRRPLKLVITASSIPKEEIGPRDLLVIAENGGAPRILDGRRAKASGGTGRKTTTSERTGPRPSAESLLHLAVARVRGAGAVLHTHSVWGTMMSELHAASGGLDLSGFEMLKGLEGVRTHEHTERVPIFDNDQDMSRLASRVEAMLASSPAVHGFLLRGHGLYTWGEDLAQAKRHVEILEFLLETAARLASARSRPEGSHGHRQNP